MAAQTRKKLHLQSLRSILASSFSMSLYDAFVYLPFALRLTFFGDTTSNGTSLHCDCRGASAFQRFYITLFSTLLYLHISYCSSRFFRNDYLQGKTFCRVSYFLCAAFLSPLLIFSFSNWLGWFALPCALLGNPQVESPVPASALYPHRLLNYFYLQESQGRFPYLNNQRGCQGRYFREKLSACVLD